MQPQRLAQCPDAPTLPLALHGPCCSPLNTGLFSGRAPGGCRRPHPATTKHEVSWQGQPHKQHARTAPSRLLLSLSCGSSQAEHPTVPQARRTQHCSAPTARRATTPSCLCAQLSQPQPVEALPIAAALCRWGPQRRCYSLPPPRGSVQCPHLHLTMNQFKACTRMHLNSGT